MIILNMDIDTNPSNTRSYVSPKAIFTHCKGLLHWEFKDYVQNPKLPWSIYR